MSPEPKHRHLTAARSSIMPQAAGHTWRHELARFFLERDRLDAERRLDQQTKDLILQMMHRLQACQAQNELAEVVARFAPQIFPPRDALTGLLNRRCLDEALNRHARDVGGDTLACLMIDIDHFTRFNDEFGHDAGDVVMRYVAQIMVETVAAAGNVYRFGGEEFTVLMPEASEATAFELAERLRIRIGTTPLSHRGHMLGSVSVSVGVASSDSGAAMTLLTRADAALLSAKVSGRNVTVLASSLAVSEGVRNRA